ncbi:MAG TPA: flagellin, partial [Hyphomicrobium sp.]|nr:flagellin [Hyphomicrobium sp.]
MASINTNVAALTALRALTHTNTALEQTQNRISTGLRVNDASDNAAYWAIATTMRSDSKALSVVQDSLGLGAATVDTAYAGINSAIGLVDQIKQKLLSARGEGVDRSKIQKEITELQGQLRGIADAAVVPGAENWLSTDSSVPGYNPLKSIVSSFTRVNASVSVQTIGVDTTNIKLYDASSVAVTG